MNELINHEAVYRTAPATPGLLKIVRAIIFQTPPWQPMWHNWLLCYCKYHAGIFSADFTTFEWFVRSILIICQRNEKNIPLW